LRRVVPVRFELAWRGGATATRLHRRRPGIDDLPWGSLEIASQAECDHARCVWSNGVFTEYASAAAFSGLATAMMQCGAPVDLIALAADIVVDELFHVELSSRLVIELGGAVPIEFDLERIAPVPTPGCRPILRAAEIAVTTSCVGEQLSVPAIAHARVLADAPLVRAVLERLLADEGPHARCGFWFLDWAAEQLTAAERAQLARLAESTIETYAPIWRDDPACVLRAAVDAKIAAPLARHGIELDRAKLALLTACGSTRDA
jgi:hypothetical protein